MNYRKISNIRCTKSPNLNDPPLVLYLSLPNSMKLSVKLRMKMQLEQRRQASYIRDLTVCVTKYQQLLVDIALHILHDAPAIMMIIKYVP